MHDPLDDGQADAGSRIFLGSMQALKYTKKLVDIAHIEANAIVSNVIDGAVTAARVSSSDLDFRDFLACACT